MKKTLLMATLLCLTGCAGLRDCDEPRYHHVVVCWLKDAGNAEHRQRIMDVSRSFRKIPGVLDVSAGEVMESERDIVDDSFDVAITFSFADEARMKAYLADPEHQRATREVLAPLVSRIVVYDFAELWQVR